MVGGGMKEGFTVTCSMGKVAEEELYIICCT